MAKAEPNEEDWNRAFQAVGEFLWNWAALESELKNALESALDIDGLKLTIVVANTQLRDKLNILKTAAHLYNNQEVAKPVIKILNDIGNFSPVRNMMAHDFFAPTDDGKAVHFYAVKAKGRLDISKVDWEPKHFDAAYAKVRFFEVMLKRNRKAFRAPKAKAMGFFNALALGAGGGTGLPGLLSPQPQSAPGFRVTNPEKAAQKPRKRKAK